MVDQSAHQYFNGGPWQEWQNLPTSYGPTPRRISSYPMHPAIHPYQVHQYQFPVRANYPHQQNMIVYPCSPVQLYPWPSFHQMGQFSPSQMFSQPSASAKSSQESEEQEEGIRPELLEKEQILAEHRLLDTSKRKFEAPVTLGYVTPWNNHGYDVAKWAAKKFTHISPVWFQIKSAVVDSQTSCSIGGTHDIDRGWMDDIRKNNTNAQIVPRFLLKDG
uniref:Chitinase domain-containing protein 1 n=1 Tax=Ditylenchus dipsaci TaxID=166011 RepID=A0A915DKP6_9BILA